MSALYEHTHSTKRLYLSAAVAPSPQGRYPITHLDVESLVPVFQYRDNGNDEEECATRITDNERIIASIVYHIPPNLSKLGQGDL